MQRDLTTLPLPPSQRSKLLKAGYKTVEDIISVKPLALSKDVGITNEEALELLQVARGREGPQTHGCTALELLKDDQEVIVTFSERLDGMLGGGVPLGKITEFCGAPGVGKTQLGIQLCIAAQIGECFGGVEGEAIYIDTEGSFIVERVADMAQAALEHCHLIATQQQHQEQLAFMGKLTKESLLGGIHYFHCHDYVELIATTHILPDFLKEHPKVKLVVMDSIAFHFRHDFDDYSLRTRLLNGMAQAFIKMATQNKLAVVFMNQMTTRVAGGTSQLVPALGESWGHASTLRVLLYWKSGTRYAHLYKSPTTQESIVPYQITTGGIRDVSENENNEPPQNHEKPHNESPQVIKPEDNKTMVPPLKRLRVDS